MIDFLQFVAAGVIVAWWSVRSTERRYEAKLAKLREERDKALAAEERWHANAMSTHATNASLMMLVELQNTHIKKLAIGNKDVPAKDN